MIGRFLEIGVRCNNVLASIGFYEALGFRQLSTGDIWPYPYAVLGDGHVQVGLHAAGLDEPCLTFVCPDLADEVNELQARGAQVERLRLGDDEFHEFMFRDPDGNTVRLVEARTFSPGAFDDDDNDNGTSLCGRFREITLPSRDLESSLVFWERLDMDRLGESDDPHPHAWVRGTDVVVGLHQTRDIDRLALSFYTPDLNARLSTLDVRGIEPDTRRAPPGVAMLRSPEGLPIFLHGI